MTYEEKYKQALKVAKKELQACGDLDCDAARQIFRLFPELKEDEDEKIRKELIEFVKSRGGFKQEYITWLEKQGEKISTEQKPVEWSDEDKELQRAIICSLFLLLINFIFIVIFII